MANQYNFNGNDDFEKKRGENQSKGVIFGIIAVIIIICAFGTILSKSQSHSGFSTDGAGPQILIILVIALFAGLSNFFTNKSKSMGASTSGREIVKQSLEALPDSYDILSNVELKHNGRDTVYDAIIVGESGVFVIGTCNRNGKLDGQEDSISWVQHKVGREGTPYSNEFKNPFKKLYFQKKLLEEFLRDKGYPTRVEEYLIIPLADSYTCTSRKVGHNQKDIIDKIQNSSNKHLNKDERNNIFYTIKNHR